MKKFLTSIISLILVFTMTPIIGGSAYAIPDIVLEEPEAEVCSIGEVTYTSLASALAIATKEDTIVLSTNTNENIVISSDSNITLDLNGYALKGTGTGSVIINEGTLEIISSYLNTPTHYFTYNDSDGCYEYAGTEEPEETANLIAVSGGVICGGNATGTGTNGYGGGIYNTGMLSISDVSIVGNRAKYGGGIYSNQRLNLNNEAVIKNNTSTGSYPSAGVLIADMSGELENTPSEVCLSGKIIIKDNLTAEKNGNLCLLNGAKILYEVITTDSDIHVSVLSAEAGSEFEQTEGAITDYYVESLEQIFESDNNEYCIRHRIIEAKENEYLELTKKIKIADGILNGSISLNKGAALGDTVTITATPDSGYYLKSLTITDSLSETENITNGKSFTMPTNTDLLPVTVNATFEIQEIIIPKESSYDDDPTPTVTVQVSGDENSVKIKATLKGKNAVVNEIKPEALENIGTSEDVTVDVSGLSANVTEATLTTKSIENIANSGALGIVVKTSNAEIRLDNATINAINEQAKGNALTLGINQQEDAIASMNEEQKKVLEEMTNPLVLDAYLISGGEKISDFKGGTSEITVKYEATGYPKGWFIDDTGVSTRQNTKSSLDKENKYVTILLKHFSHYVIEEVPLKDVLSDMKLRANTKYVKSNGKKYIKITTKVTSGIEELENLLLNGYTYKYVYLRGLSKEAFKMERIAAKKATNFVDMNGKNGKYYYYKVLIKVYDKKGEEVASTQFGKCKYGSRRYK